MRVSSGWYLKITFIKVVGYDCRYSLAGKYMLKANYFSRHVEWYCLGVLELSIFNLLSRDIPERSHSEPSIRFEIFRYIHQAAVLFKSKYYKKQLRWIFLVTRRSSNFIKNYPHPPPRPWMFFKILSFLMRIDFHETFRCYIQILLE